MALPQISIEAINHGFNPVFVNTVNDDMAIYTENTTQRIHLGCGGNGTRNAMLTVGASNVTTGGDLVLGSATAPFNVCAGNLGMFRNRIINGDMRINQRGATSLVIGLKGYFIDRWMIDRNGTNGQITASIITLSSTDAPFLQGFKHSMRFTATQAHTNYNFFYGGQTIEGLNVADLNWGTNVGSSVTLSYWMRTNLAPGSTIGVSVRNIFSSPRTVYNTTATVTTTNGWSYHTTTIPAPPNGSTWATDNGAGIEIMLGCLSFTNVTTVNAWTTDILHQTAITNWPATLGNFVEFTGVQFEKGNTPTPFEFRPFPIELQLCQRYYRNVGAGGQATFYSVSTNSSFETSVPISPVMRAPPSLALLNGTLRAYASGVTENFTYTASTLYIQSKSSTSCVILNVQIGNQSNTPNGTKPLFLLDDVVTANAEF